VEDTTPADGSVTIETGAPSGTAVRPAGGDVPEGTVVLEPGERLGPAHLGVLSSLGVARPTVRRRPAVAILSTGDEIEPPETTTLGPGKIRDANRFVLRGLLEELGAVVIDHGIVGDDPGNLTRVLGHAAANADVVLTSGGVSMGDYDVVKHELRKLGTVDFWKVAMQPAKPFAFGRIDATPLFGLPGNPVSVFVAFEQFVRPALLHMMGAQALYRPRVPATIEHDVATDPEKTVFLRVVATQAPDGSWSARSAGGQSSNVLSAMAAANAFAVVPRGTADVAAGGTVELELFTHPSVRSREEALGG
jgi:molybdopterin molybdotransferase